MYDRGADLKIISAEEAGQPPQRKEDLPKDSDRQKEEFWDAAEYAADCHLLWSAIRESGRIKPYVRT